MKQNEVKAPIFNNDWWLDVVAPSNWDKIEIIKGGEIFAELPYVKKNKKGLTCLVSPLLTPFLGIQIRINKGKYVKRMSNEMKLIDKIVTQLPKFDLFRQNFHPDFTNWLPMYWNNFEQTTRYTYRFNDLTDLDKIWNNFDSTLRRNIRKADKNKIRVNESDDIEAFLEVNKKTFTRQGMDLPYSEDLVRRIDQACKKRNARKIFLAYGPNKKIHSGAFCVYDNCTIYNLMQGSDPDLRNSGANSLVLWIAIQKAANIVSRFDFEGSMIEPIENYYRKFGANLVPYYQIQKMSNKYQTLSSGKKMIKSAFNLG